MKIVIIEDERDLAELLAFNLEKEGYQPLIALDGTTGLQRVMSEKPALVILDLMLPGMNGIDLCKLLKKQESTAAIPVIMLTAKGEEIDRVVGLEVGADDYLTKPFSMRELLARVKAQLRRTRLIREEMTHNEAALPYERLAFGGLIIDQTRREVTLDDSPLQLKPKEYELLLFLAQHRGQMLTREFILERVWGWDYVGDSRTVDVHVAQLRRKLANSRVRIETVTGVGYKLVY